MACPSCGSGRVLRHPELDGLALAHIDCDAFYASVEKRDDPSLIDRPLIVGGGTRGVVTTACYIARRFGVRSAMPMFKARALCPEAVVIRPDMAKYAAVSRSVRAVFLEATPQVEMLSLDEAYLDLAGTEALHRAIPALTLARTARRIEREIGITVSVGLSHNKLLAKLASELDKPRGFGVVGRAETTAFLAAKPIRALPGIGPKSAARLASEGLESVAQLQALGPRGLRLRYGDWGERLAALARGEDARMVEPERDAKGISSETTFASDIGDRVGLEAALWPLCETLAARLKKAEAAASGVVLKLKTADFRLRTRQKRLDRPTQNAELLFRAGAVLLAPEIGAQRYRLIGIGATALVPATELERIGDLFAPPSASDPRLDQAIDQVRARFGDAAIGKGRGLAASLPKPRR